MSFVLFSQYIQDFFNQSNYDRRGEYLSDSAVMWLWSFTVSLYCVGAATGAMCAGYFCEKLGRYEIAFENKFYVTAYILEHCLAADCPVQ